MYYIEAGAINHFIPFVNKYDVLGQTTYSKKTDRQIPVKQPGFT